MDFVDDIDAVFRGGRRKICFFTQGADIFDAVVAGRINLDDIHDGTVVHAAADFAFTAGIAVNGMQAVDRFCQDLRTCRLPRSARTGKQVGVRDAPGLQLVFQRDGDLRLPDHIGKFLRPPFPVKHLIQAASPPFHDFFDKGKQDRPFSRLMRQDMRTNRPTASHREFRLMLLGSPPDMVHGALPHRARPPAYLIARISALLSRTAGTQNPSDTAFLLYPFFAQKATVFLSMFRRFFPE